MLGDETRNKQIPIIHASIHFRKIQIKYYSQIQKKKILILKTIYLEKQPNLFFRNSPSIILEKNSIELFNEKKPSLFLNSRVPTCLCNVVGFETWSSAIWPSGNQP